MEWEKASREELMVEGQRLERLLELFARGRVSTEQEIENAVTAAIAAERFRAAKIRAEEFGRMYVAQVNALETWNHLGTAITEAYRATRDLVELVRASKHAFVAEYQDQATPASSTPGILDEGSGADSKFKDALEAFAKLDVGKLQ